MSKVSYHVDERGVAVMKIDNPPMNALDEQVMFEIEDCARRIPSDEKVKWRSGPSSRRSWRG